MPRFTKGNLLVLITHVQPKGHQFIFCSLSKFDFCSLCTFDV